VSAGVSTSGRTARRRRSARLTVRRAAFAGGFLVVLALVVGLVYSGSTSRLADGTQIAGVDVGGLSSARARALLEERAAAVEKVPVRFTAAGRSWELAPSQLGIRVDWAAAVEVAEADGDGFGPVRGYRRLHTRLFGAEVTPSVAAFESVLAYAVEDVAKAVDRPAVEASLRRNGLGVRVVAGRAGLELDRARAAEAIVRALAALERGRPVALPTVRTEPKVTPGDLVGAAERTRVALSAPVTLVVGQKRIRLPRWRIAKLLRLPSGGAVEPEIAGRAADAWFAALQRSVNRPARDATFRVVPGGIRVVPDAPGRSLDVAGAAELIRKAAFSAERRLVTLPVVVTPAERTTAEAKAMGITGVVGSYTTTYGGTPGRLANVQLVSELIDGTLIAPGATFSFNDTTGERNADKGFQEAPVIINGELRNGIGGGVCQVSTTVFNAAFEAGLPIGRRTNHALYISHYPLGRDATVNYPDLDLTFSNDTGSWMLLRAFVNPGALTVNLYGAPQDRRVESETGPLTVTGKVPVKRVPDPELVKGKRVIEVVGTPPRETSVQRRVYSADGELMYENTWASYYVGEPTVVRVGTKPKPKPPAAEPDAGEAKADAKAGTTPDAEGAAAAEPAVTTPSATTPRP
jgi:vancomycin resistance protein YoaR